MFDSTGTQITVSQFIPRLQAAQRQGRKLTERFPKAAKILREVEKRHAAKVDLHAYLNGTLIAPTTRELAQATGRNLSTVQHVLKAMWERGEVVRVAVPTGKRGRPPYVYLLAETVKKAAGGSVSVPRARAAARTNRKVGRQSRRPAE
jgi:hypothetical protein